MTVPAIIPQITFAGSSGSGTFGPFSLIKNGTPITFTTNSQIKVYRYDTTTDVAPTLLVEGTDYDLEGGPSAGSITLTPPEPLPGEPDPVGLLDTERLFVYREQPTTQTMDLVTGGNFSAANLEARLDRTTEMIQELRREVQSTVRFSLFDADNIPNTLPLGSAIDRLVYVTGTTSAPVLSSIPLPGESILSASDVTSINLVAADLYGADTIGIVAADLDGANNIGTVAGVANTLSTNIADIVTVANALNDGTIADIFDGVIAYILQSSVSVVRLLADGNFSPSSVTFSAFQDNSLGERTTYAGLFVISTSVDGSTYTEQYTSVTPESSKSFTISSGVNFVRCQLFRADDDTLEVQQYIVSIVRDGVDGSSGSGTDAVVVNLSKSSATVFAYADGTVPSFDGIDGQVTVFVGTSDETSSASFSVSGSGLSGEINTATDTPISGKPKGYYRVTSMSADIGSLTITTSYGGVNYVRSFSVSKIKTGYEIVTTLPSTNLFEGRLVFLTTDDKLYRYTGSAWTAAVAATDLTGQVVASQISDAAITTAKFAASIEPISIVSSVPGTKSTSSVFNTTDGFLYRWNGTAYVKAVPAADVTGTLTNAQIADLAATKITGTLTNAQIADLAATKITGTLTNAQIADLAATKITGTLTNAQIADLAATKITGTLTNAQIADLAATKITGTLTNAQIADVAAAKITGAITETQIGTNAVTTAKISAGAVVTAKLAAGAVTANEISAGAVTTAKLAAGAVTANEIATNAITAVKINAGAVETAKLAAGAVTANEIATNAVTAVKINAGAVTTAKLAAGAVTANEIATNAITAVKISAGAVETAKLAAGAVTANEIATNAITAVKISAGAVETAKLAAGAVTATTIAAGAVTTAKLAAGAVTANEIAANTITAGQIASGAIATDELAAGAVTAAKIAAGTITADKIAANTITAGQIAAATITATQLATNAITADKISAGAVTAAKIGVTNLAAINADLGAITAGSLSINSKFIVDSSGNVTIRNGTTGARLVVTNSLVEVYDASNVLRVRLGIW